MHPGKAYTPPGCRTSLSPPPTRVTHASHLSPPYPTSHSEPNVLERAPTWPPQVRETPTLARRSAGCARLCSIPARDPCCKTLEKQRKTVRKFPISLLGVLVLESFWPVTRPVKARFAESSSAIPSDCHTHPEHSTSGRTRPCEARRRSTREHSTTSTTPEYTACSNNKTQWFFNVKNIRIRPYAY